MRLAYFMLLLGSLFSVSNAFGQGDAFVCVISTENGKTISIQANNSDVAFDFNVDWGDGTIDLNQTQYLQHTYDLIDEYTISITGTFPSINIFASFGHPAFKSVEQWGDNAWTSTSGMFSSYVLDGFSINAIDAPNFANCEFTSSMFRGIQNLNGNFTNWDLSSVLNVSEMFSGCCNFNGDLSNWNLPLAENFDFMFSGCDHFEGIGLDTWNVLNMQSARGIFSDCTTFNKDISGWDVSHLTDGSRMFYNCTNFNQDLSSWQTSSLEDMELMFSGSAFNQNIASWDVSQVTDMREAFKDSDFNQDLNGWDVSSVSDFFQMLAGTPFNHALSDWDLNSASIMTSICEFSQENYDATLMGWAANPNTTSGVNLNTASPYCVGETARNILVNDLNWNISDRGLDCFTTSEAFSFRYSVETPNVEATVFTIPLIALNNLPFNYNVSWGDGTFDYGVTGLITHAFTSGGTKTVSITGACPAIDFNENQNVKSINQWGNIAWQFKPDCSGIEDLVVGALDVPNFSQLFTTSGMFARCTNLSGNFANWDLSTVNSVNDMFRDCSNFNENLNNWNLQNTTVFSNMFRNCEAFNGDMSGWIVGNINYGNSAFENAAAFDQKISQWNVSNMMDASNMFKNSAFNQNISGWDVAVLQIAEGMFESTPFNQDISSWDVSSLSNANNMFKNATAFNHSLGNWSIGSLFQAGGMLDYCGMTTNNYDATLIGWSQQPIQFGGAHTARGISFCEGAEARLSMIENSFWYVVDGGPDCSFKGCTDPMACNFDPGASDDDGSCDYSCYGCTYFEANNFDPIYLFDDGSCDFGPTPLDCLADVNNDGEVDSADLLILLSEFGSQCGI